jgi:serine/threonine protein kinase
MNASREQVRKIPFSEVTIDENSRFISLYVTKGLWKNNGEHHEVALKKFTDHEELKYEAELLRKCQSPFVVELLGLSFDLANKHLYIVMELMAHGSLYRYISDFDGWDHPTASSFRLPLQIKLLKDIIAGIAFLHSENIIHRDLKSPNVLLGGSERRLTAKIADLGLAQDNKKPIEIPVPEPVLLLPWSAPEQGNADIPLHTAIDIFSFGVIMLEIISKATAPIPNYGDLNKEQIIPASCPYEISELINQCGSFKPEDRPTAEAIQKTLVDLDIPEEGNIEGAIYDALDNLAWYLPNFS